MLYLLTEITGVM